MTWTWWDVGRCRRSRFFRTWRRRIGVARPMPWEARWRQPAPAWQWRRERQEVLRPGMGYPGIVDLIEAAGAERTLRQLYPYNSHFALHLSSCTRYPYVLRVPSVLPRYDGRFRAFVPRVGTLLGETDTAEAAVALVVAHLPAGLGPAVVGSADDLRR
ncbi:DUF6193 family natural product biosynthesis protein [Streptomyces mirabilis]|uniref:DUF6193 family natural product biosynthesis protein n=1 Tax=Streptomyces mirabilis TaxID=68239 RepID=UPI0036E576AC